MLVQISYGGTIAAIAVSRPKEARCPPNDEVADDSAIKLAEDLPVAAVLGKSQGLRSRNPAWETARVNILRLVLLGLAALAGIVTGAALLEKALRPETSSAPLIATASTQPGEPGRRLMKSTPSGARLRKSSKRRQNTQLSSTA